MYDQSLFLQTLSRFARVLPAQYDLELALGELTESVAAVLGLVGPLEADAARVERDLIVGSATRAAAVRDATRAQTLRTELEDRQ